MNISSYLFLIQQFVSGNISALDFERDYLLLFKSDNRSIPHEVYEILNKLFSDIDAFCSNSLLRGNDDLDEPALKECAKAAYGALLKL